MEQAGVAVSRDPRFAISAQMAAAAAAAATNKNHFLAKLGEVEVNKRLLRERHLLHQQQWKECLATGGKQA